MQQKVRKISFRSIIIVGALLFASSLITACGGSSSPTSSSTPQATSTGAGTTPTTQPSPTPVVDRHGLPANVPLPNNGTFNSQNVYVTFKAGPISLSNFKAGCISFPTNKTWVWTVASPNTPTIVQQFYQGNLSSQGWSFIHASQACQAGSSILSGCQGTSSKQLLLVEVDSKITLTDSKGNATSTVTAPAGGSVLAISVMAAEPGHTDPTLGIFIPGTADIFCR